jgi:hypothetical protein
LLKKHQYGVIYGLFYMLVQEQNENKEAVGIHGILAPLKAFG